MAAASPSNHASFRRRARAGTRRWLAGLLALTVLGIGACATPPPPAPPPPAEPHATVRLENLSDRSWRVALLPADAGGAEATPAWRAVAPRETRAVTLPPGVYRVRAELADSVDTAEDAAIAGERVELRAGRVYTWPLATLLTTEETTR